jgi:hypothetical protein
MNNSPMINHVPPPDPDSTRNELRYRWEAIGLIVIVALLELLFAFYSSGGNWTDWPTSSSYYNQLADGFLQGKPYLLTDPPPELASLPNPYTQTARRGISVIWDVSYYQGRYYLYWGPVPSLGIALARSLADISVGDYVVVLIASCGSLLFLTLILWELRRQFFPRISVWIFYLSVTAATLGSAYLWILNRPMVYEGAIASGQFFLLAGIFFILPAFPSSRYQPWRHLLAATCWMLALGCRISIIGAIGVLVFAAIFLLIRSGFSRKRATLALLLLCLPFLIGAGLYGRYNTVRFGNPLETGLRYQFTDNDYSNPANPMFSLWAVPINVYNYFGRHVKIEPVFPFLIPIDGKATYNPLPFPIPTLYYAEPVTALPFSAPLLFCIAGLGLSIPSIRKRFAQTATRDGNPEAETRFRFFWMSLLAATLLAFAPLLFYWYAAERFVLDFLPLALILAACGAWKLVDFSQAEGRRQKLIASLVAGLSIATAVISALLAVTGYGNHWK